MNAFEVTWDGALTLLTTRVRRGLSVNEVVDYGDALSSALAAIADAEKMLAFDQRLGRVNERYFSDVNEARRWLLER